MVENVLVECIEFVVVMGNMPFFKVKMKDEGCTTPENVNFFFGDDDGHFIKESGLYFDSYFGWLVVLIIIRCWEHHWHFEILVF